MTVRDRGRCRGSINPLPRAVRVDECSERERKEKWPRGARGELVRLSASLSVIGQYLRKMSISHGGSVSGVFVPTEPIKISVLNC